MDQLNTRRVDIPRCRILVCKECGTGVVKAYIATHLNSKHAYLTASTRTDVAQTARAMDDLAENEDGVVYPEPGSDPVPHLRVWQDGFRCDAKESNGTTCGYIRRTVQDMQLHCRNKHKWSNPRKRGRTSKGLRIETNRMWTKSICCQKFAHAGRLGQLFEVISQDRGEKERNTGGENVMI